ncbi:MAG TPA: hypothetical protein VK841_11770 [Polyangiaceae bacterium]|nr:hypothetical protein [Polyangiaceae bacterium]
MRAKKSRKSAFVPRVLVRTAIVGVTPACAVARGNASEPSMPVADAGHDAGFIGVAAVAYRAFDSGASDGESGGEPADAKPDVFRGPVPLAIRAYEVDPSEKGT